MSKLSAPLTLGDVLAQEDLQLRLVAGGDEALARPIVGAHTVDLPHPGEWVDRNWLILMTGVSLNSDPGGLREMIGELAEAGVAALGFGLQPLYDHVPAELLEAAREAELPVVAVPDHVPFRRIVESIFRSTLSEDVRASQRLMSMQRYLMDALGDELPQRTTIERLATLLGGETALLLTRHGHVVAATGAFPLQALWGEISKRPATVLELEIERTPWIAAPVTTGEGIVSHWLACSAAAGASPGVAKAAVHLAIPLLTAIDRLEAVRRGQQRAARGALLDRLLLGDADSVVGAQIEQLGVSTEDGLVVALLAPGSAGDAPALLPLVEAELEQVGAPFVAGQRGEGVAVVVPAPALGPATLAFEALAAAGRVGCVALGDAAASIDAVPQSLQQARIARTHATGREGGPIWRFDAIDTPAAIFGAIPLEPVRDQAERIVGELREHPAALETLQAFFANRMSVSATADEMHLHPNSLRYRLARIEEIVGGSIRDPATIAALFVVLRAYADD